MDLNSPLFDSIRIKPSCDEPKTAATQTCETPGCKNPGLYRAPKGRKAEGQYWRFCMDHVRAYNATYNYFDGMNDAAVQAFQKDAIIGHRPTWAMGVNPATAGERGKAAPEPRRPRHSAATLKALDVLGLDENADSAAIKAQYKTLVKRFHPDANGGDRSFEERLRDIIRAHDALRAAGLC
jgi:hypothetical protein